MGPGEQEIRQRGFTLMEMLAVVMIIMILAGIALPGFRAAIFRARVATLQEDLYNMRRAIDQYHADKGKYPQDLETLKTDGYLRFIRKDPTTDAVDWVTEQSDEDPDNPSEEPGIKNVCSANPNYSCEDGW
jgi:general secretion pathway protein G